jgi:hypothetical protein
MQVQDIIPSTKAFIKDLPPKQQVRAMLEQNKSAIAKALPRHLGTARLLRVAQTRPLGSGRAEHCPNSL